LLREFHWPRVHPFQLLALFLGSGEQLTNDAFKVAPSQRRPKGNALKSNTMPDGQPLIAAANLVNEAQVLVVKRGAQAPVAVTDTFFQLGNRITAHKAVTGERRVIGFPNPRVIEANRQP